MRFLTLTTALVVAALCCQPALAQKKKNKPAGKPPGTADNPAKNLVPGARVEQKVTTLTNEVHWHSSLQDALKQAREEKKAVFWLHALGDLEGDT